MDLVWLGAGLAFFALSFEFVCFMERLRSEEE
jgi:hypothetical protein